MKWDRRYTYLIFVMLCLSIPIATTAAADLTVVWNRTYGGADGNESAYAIMEYPGGPGYLFAGETDSYGAGGTDAWVVNITTEGNETWNQTYGRGENDTARAIIPALNATSLFAGTYTFITDNTRRDTDAWAVAINGSGGEIWNTTYGGKEVNATARSVANASDGGYLLAGTLEPYETGSTDALVVKVNETGGEVWNRTYGEPEANETANAIVAMPGGGYAFAGATASSGTEGTDARIVMIDGNGSEVWNRTYGNGGEDEARALAVTTDGDLLVAGTSALMSEKNRTNTDAFVLRLTANGSTVWNATYGTPDDNTSANAVIATEDGGILIAGDRAPWGAEDSDALLIKLDSDGKEIWNWTYGGIFRDQANAVLQSGKEEYVFAGRFTTAAKPANVTDAWAVKLRVVAAPTPTPTSVTPTPTPTATITPTPTPTAPPRPGINLTKYTDGIDAKVPPGPIVTVGDTVMWTYNVTNNGTVPLTNISVTDDKIGVISGPDAGDTNTNGILDPNETWVYSRNGTAVSTATLPGGYYENNATVTAEDAGKVMVNATDVSHYTSAAINLTKFTDGEDAKVPPGPVINIGEMVTWTYNVTNDGAVPLTNVSVTDDQIGPISGPLQGDNNGILDPGETWTYEATGTAVNTSTLPGVYYENNATVTADGPTGRQATATDVSHYINPAVPTTAPTTPPTTFPTTTPTTTLPTTPPTTAPTTSPTTPTNTTLTTVPTTTPPTTSPTTPTNTTLTTVPTTTLPTTSPA